MLVTCKECNTSFTLEDRGIKKAGSKVRCSRCKNVFVVYPPESYSTPAVPEEFDALEPGSGHEEDFSEEEEIAFDELDKMLESDEELELEEVTEVMEEEPALPGVGDIYFSDVEKMLETGEIKLDEMGLEKNGVKDMPGDGEAFDLSELETAIDKSDDAGIDEIEEVPEELKFDYDREKDAVLSKIKDVEEIDFSDLEDMTVSRETAKPPEKHEMEAERLDFESEEDIALEKTAEDLEFSDLEDILAGEKPGGEKEEDVAQELEFNLDLEPSGAETEDHADEDTGLDFSDVEKMLEMEGVTGEQESDREVFESQPGTDETGLEVSSEEPEHEDVHKHLEGFEIDRFHETREREAEKAPVVVAEEEEKDKKEVKKARKPLKIKKPSGRFIIILGIVVALLLGAGAFVIYNPFDIEIPFVSDFLGSKADVKGNLKITPVADSIKGDYVDAKFGTLFVISGNVKNDYKHPRSYIRVIGKLYAKGKKLSRAETVFCGNIVSEQDIANLEPVVLKKHLINRSGDKKSNVKVKPGSTIPFMIIYENPSLDLDEFIVEAESSMKE
jgi:predicted Zn finger-like uncharacterized protein